MSLASEYQRQWQWRDWSSVFAALPSLAGHTVLDLGCGVGDQAAELAARGARVIGFDANEELLREARSRHIENAEFKSADLRMLPKLGVPIHGLWSSFAAAYFPDLSTVLADWSKHLEPGAWIALTEVDDLFGHEPLGARAKSLFEAYTTDALAHQRYDFQMGRKLQSHLERSGFTVSRVWTVPDQELSFSGAALPEVLDAWSTRLDRMQLLRDMGGAAFEEIRDDFLSCLARSDHRSMAKVYCCLAELRP